MSFLRAAFNARTAFRPPPSARRYATITQPKKENLPLWLGGAGVVGLALYIYLQGTPKEVAEKILQKTEAKSPLDPNNFVDFKLKRKEPYNHNTAKITFELPDNQPSLLPIASCVIVRSASDASQPFVADNGKPVIRPYTPISPSDKPGELTFLIKRYDNGKMSKYVHSLQPGEKLAIKGPIMKIPYKPNEFEEIGMIAGGSGITPMYQVLTHALRDKGNKTKFTLIFANITPKDILLREEFDALKAQHPDTFNVVYTVDKPDVNWTGPTGHVSKELVKAHVGAPSMGDKVKVFVCGPDPQVAAVAGPKDGMKQGPVGGILKELGYTEDQVFKF